jgi:2,4-diaminopentanoate dehydrogenase
MSYRVIQWATGGVGEWCLRRVIEHPDLELVGCLVYSSEKAGRDAGELCGMAPTGVTATMDVDAILALDAEVVLYAPRLPDDNDVARLLASGKNVITPVSYFSPTIDGPELITKLDAAARAGGASLFGTGIDPGFVCDRVPAVLTGICAEVTQIRMEEVFDCSKHPLAEMMFDLLGFGKGPQDLHLDSAGGVYFSQRLFPAVPDKLARALGVQLDAIEMGNVEFAFATRDFEIPAGRVREGTIAGLSYDYVGTVDGEPFITQRWVHHVGQHLGALPSDWRTAPDPESEGLKSVQDGGYPIYEIVVEIDGRPSFKNRMFITDPKDPVWQGTAHALLRTIPDVCAAPPGVLEEPVFAAWRPRLGQRPPVSMAPIDPSTLNGLDLSARWRGGALTA